MGTPALMPASPNVPRAVLGANVVLSALVFVGGPAARLRDAWQAGALLPLASTASIHELIRVLACPKFKLDVRAQEELLADYLPWVEVVAVPQPPPDVPACRDAHDLPFLYLAVAGRADVLVTGDADLLALAAADVGSSDDAAPEWRCRVLTLHAFLDTLAT
jgi:putative PIN family toxin of toxin-antitoxin system